MNSTGKTYTIIAPTTAAVEAPDYGLFNSTWYKHVVVACDTLAGAEEVDIYILVNGKYLVAVDTDNEVAKLTATAPVITLPGGPVYAFLKDATAGAAGVFALLSLGAKRR
jgi:hypothetical protein